MKFDFYRDNTRTLLRENEKLQTQVAQTEKDTVDVISFLRDEDIKKNNQVLYNRLAKKPVLVFTQVSLIV